MAVHWPKNVTDNIKFAVVFIKSLILQIVENNKIENE